MPGINIEFHRLIDELYNWCSKEMTANVREKCDGPTRTEAVRWWIACRSSGEFHESMDEKDLAGMLMTGYPPLPSTVVGLADYLWDNWVELEHPSGYNECVTALLSELNRFYGGE